MKKAIGLLFGVVFTVGSLAFAPAASASDYFPAADPVYTYENQATRRCIDDTDQGGFRTWPCNGTNPQRWTVHAWADNTYRFQNVNTGRCIDDSSQRFRTWPCNNGQNQSWFFKPYNDGTRRFQNQATGRCMDDSGQGFRTWPCNDGQNQSWFRR